MAAPTSPGPLGPDSRPDDRSDDPVTPALSSSPPARARSALRVLIVLSLAATIGGLATLAVTARSSLRGTQPAPPANAHVMPDFVAGAVHAAQQGMLAALSLDAKTFDKNLAELQRWSTGAYADHVATDLAPAGSWLRLGQREASAVLIGAGAAAADQNEAVVLVAVDVAISEVDGKGVRKSRREHHRMEVTVRRTEDGWRIAACVPHSDPALAQPKPWPTVC